ncbi:ATP-binding protein [Paraburkholderia agricolaris]|uniref:DEAD/DEAH box helicase n=1 Tax=Paraburkholderia agricolaris TaxID=2152888 RepID=UPI0038B75C41
MKTTTVNRTTTATADDTKRDRWKEAEAALNFWQALEYLAPQSPPAVKLEESVWELSHDAAEREMAWNDPKKRAILDAQIGPNRKFQLFAGILSGGYFIEVARHYLGASPLDDSERRPPSPAACVVLDINGEGMASGQVFISTVPWALAQISNASGKAGKIDFRGFFGMRGLEEKIREKVTDLMVERRLLRRPVDDAYTSGEADEQPDAAPAPTAPASVGPIAETTAVSGTPMPEPTPLRPVTSEDVRAITALVFDMCGWRPEREESWRIQAHWVPKNETESATTQDDPLNSFYAEDLERVTRAVEAGHVGPGLTAYLQGEDSPGRVDLEQQIDRLIDGVHPSLQPPGCWPAKFPLVTAQQFAVNTALRDLTDAGGLFSVNGPPGTGKTTMLKDIISAVVVRRADVLVEFANPESAFRKRLDIEQYQYPVYELDARLRGFGMVVSSANNGAVENITKELPGRSEIDEQFDVDYFSVVADSVAALPKAKQVPAQRQRWGLVTAVLGNKGNRSQFASRFWLSGLPANAKPGEPPAPLDPLRLRSLQDLVKTGEHGALSWDVARMQYRRAREKVTRLTRQATELADAIQLRVRATSVRRQALSELTRYAQLLPGQLEVLRDTQAALAAATNAQKSARLCLGAGQKWIEAEHHVAAHQKECDEIAGRILPGALDDAKDQRVRADTAYRRLQADIEFHQRNKPGFLSELFRTPYSRRWNERCAELEAQLRAAREHESRMIEALAHQESLQRAFEARVETLKLAQQRSLSYKEEARNLGVPFDDASHDAQQPAGLLDRLGRAAIVAGNSVDVASAAAQAAQTTADATKQRVSKMQAQQAQAETDLERAEQVLSSADVPPGKIKHWDLAGLEREAMHSAAPYEYPALFQARRELFVAAMALHQAFIVAAWKRLARTLSAFVNLLQSNLNPVQIPKGSIHLWDAFFLVVPVVSTTFASFPRLFSGIGREELAWLMIDEAGQAAPQQAVGAIWRSRNTVIVGDPLQLEPVVSVPQEMITPLLKRCSAEEQWAPPLASAQTLADRANRHGMYLGEPGSDEQIWLGSPLLVHRRCLDPMFRISNSIAYEDKMVYGAGEDQGPPGIGPSKWIHVPAEHSEGHWVEAQAHRAMELVQAITGGKLKEKGRFKVYVISPFRTVAYKIRLLLLKRYGEESKGMSGTVHTFQGKEAEHVVFLLGGNPSSPGVISAFAGAKPNLVNVAVTRAKRRLYVVGDRKYWTGASDIHRIFTRMAEHLDESEMEWTRKRTAPDIHEAGFSLDTEI